MRRDSERLAGAYRLESASRPGPKVGVRPVSLREARKLRPIESGFQTDRVLRLDREALDGSLSWRLREEQLPHPFVKRYDSGKLGEWLELYADTARPADFHFVVGSIEGRAESLLTWRYMTWNSALWLVDIRTRPEARRLGVGSALVEYLQHVARRRRVRGISVETQISNYPAVCFYRKHGFEIVGFNDHHYTNHDFPCQDVALFLFWETL